MGFDLISEEDGRNYNPLDAARSRSIWDVSSFKHLDSLQVQDSPSYVKSYDIYMYICIYVYIA